MMRSTTFALALLVSMTGGGAARAGGNTPDAPDPTDHEPFAATIANAEAGRFNPFSSAARIEGRGTLVMLSGYDQAYRAAALNANAEVRVWGPIAVRVGIVWVAQHATVGPTAGLRVQALRQERHGVDLSVGAQYRPEGLTEPYGEGELEAVVAIGRRFGRLGLLANVSYGQDLEADDRDGELLLAGMYTISDRFRVGIDSRLRIDLGSNPANLAAGNKATFDVVAGPMASYLVGPVALVATVGYSGVTMFNTRAYTSGVLAMGGIGGAF